MGGSGKRDLLKECVVDRQTAGCEIQRGDEKRC